MITKIIIIAMCAVLLGIAFWMYRKARKQEEAFTIHILKENMDFIMENLDLTIENKILKEKFKNELYNGAFNEWEIVEDTEGNRDFYLEKDGIRLIFDNKKCIGWYKPNDYEAPSAEVIN